MNKCIADIQNIICVTYLDDVLIYGKNFEEHIKDVEKSLQRLRENRVKLNPEKMF